MKISNTKPQDNNLELNRSNNLQVGNLQNRKAVVIKNKSSDLTAVRVGFVIAGSLALLASIPLIVGGAVAGPGLVVGGVVLAALGLTLILSGSLPNSRGVIWMRSPRWRGFFYHRPRRYRSKKVVVTPYSHHPRKSRIIIKKNPIRKPTHTTVIGRQPPFRKPTHTTVIDGQRPGPGQRRAGHRVRF